MHITSNRRDLCNKTQNNYTTRCNLRFICTLCMWVCVCLPSSSDSRSERIVREMKPHMLIATTVDVLFCALNVYCGVFLMRRAYETETACYWDMTKLRRFPSSMHRQWRHTFDVAANLRQFHRTQNTSHMRECVFLFLICFANLVSPNVRLQHRPKAKGIYGPTEHIVECIFIADN